MNSLTPECQHDSSNPPRRVGAFLSSHWIGEDSRERAAALTLVPMDVVGPTEVREGGEQQILLDSLQVCRNLIDATSRLHDPIQTRAICETTRDLLTSIHRLRRTVGLSPDTEALFNDTAVEVESRLGRCAAAIEAASI